MPLTAIDPGPEQSAFVSLSLTGNLHRPDVLRFAKKDNFRMSTDLRQPSGAVDPVCIEMIASYGMPVGAEVFETCVWIGRFIEASSGPSRVFRITRNEVKLHLCGATRGVNDAVLRQAIIDRYGPGKGKAIGCKKTPGPLYGITGDCWQALALGLTWIDLYAGERSANGISKIIGKWPGRETDEQVARALNEIS